MIFYFIINICLTVLKVPKPSPSELNISYFLN